jgi:hypothetical protein
MVMNTRKPRKEIGLEEPFLPCLDDSNEKCSRDAPKVRFSPGKIAHRVLLLLILFIGGIHMIWVCRLLLENGIKLGQSGLRFPQGGNRTIVFLIGNLRCGEPAWESLYKNVLDFNSADLGLVVGASDDKYNDASLWKRAKYIFREKEYDDWGDALGTFLIFSKHFV